MSKIYDAVEEKIREAMERGDFDNLPGKGKPLDLTDWQNTPEEQRMALSLAFFQGYSHSEIAEILNEPLGTVKTRIRLGMQKLRQVLVY